MINKTTKQKQDLVKVEKEIQNGLSFGIIFDFDGVYVEIALIPHDYEHFKPIFFVDDRNGDSYGQFDNIHDAIEKAKYMICIDKKERKKYDE